MTWNGSSRADASLPTQIPFSKYIYCKSIPLRILTESNLGSDSKKHQTKNLNLLQNKNVNRIWNTVNQTILNILSLMG